MLFLNSADNSGSGGDSGGGGGGVCVCRMFVQKLTWSTFARFITLIGHQTYTSTNSERRNVRLMSPLTRPGRSTYISDC